MNKINQDLTFALSKLHSLFEDDKEYLHLAVSIVFSSIFNSYGIKLVIVGGQASSYWMRITGSLDSDFVTENFDAVRNILLQIGFKSADKMDFRFLSQKFDVLIELVGERIDICGIYSFEVTKIMPEDVENETIRFLMPKNAFVIDPTAVFINYLDSSIPGSIWFDHKDEGRYAQERAMAIFLLYKSYILKSIKRSDLYRKFSKSLIDLLANKYSITIK